MKLSCLVLLLSIFLAKGASAAEAGQGGLAECLSLSLTAALNAYTGGQKLSKIPTVTLAPSQGSPSNGIDVQVSFEGGTTYYVIASPNGGPGGLKGCTGASVGYSN